MARITVVGAGVVGVWQAATLAGRGHDVRLIERSSEPFAQAASRLAGAMLAPFCEAEAAEPIVRDMGLRSLDVWRERYPGLRQCGSLVVAQPRDQGELTRFARMTEGFEEIDGARIAELEPALAGRYERGLFYPREAHVEPVAAMSAVLAMARDAGVREVFGEFFAEADQSAGSAADPDGYVVDCRGLGAGGELSGLRGVRGEMLVIATDEISLTRPVRLLHPRYPLYAVPWRGGRFMIGATVIESAEDGAVSVRSALELLGMAYTLHPAFGEARIIEFTAGVRPAFSDNIPRIVVRGRTIHVNGLYRHGYLVSPALAQAVADYIERGVAVDELFVFE
jgi:glycine oxidase